MTDCIRDAFFKVVEEGRLSLMKNKKLYKTRTGKGLQWQSRIRICSG